MAKLVITPIFDAAFSEKLCWRGRLFLAHASELVLVALVPRKHCDQIMLGRLNNCDFHYVADVQIAAVLHVNQPVDFWRVGP